MGKSLWSNCFELGNKMGLGLCTRPRPRSEGMIQMHRGTSVICRRSRDYGYVVVAVIAAKNYVAAVAACSRLLTAVEERKLQKYVHVLKNCRPERS